MGALVPAWSFIVGQTDRNGSFISEQHSAAPAVAQLDALVATINTKGGGRAFAGDPSDWGAYFTVGEVPVYEYLASEDVDEVGFTVRTASLMTDPSRLRRVRYPLAGFADGHALAGASGSRGAPGRLRTVGDSRQRLRTGRRHARQCHCDVW
jgi:hypothetical protein